MSRLVELDDTSPLGIGPEDTKDGRVWVCRCGLSARWPLCDGSHRMARTEDPGVAYRYRRDETGALTRMPVIENGD